MPLPALVIVVLVLASLAASTAWRLAGNTLYFVSTPSMCPSLCVGSLVMDVPAKGATLHVGETITFHPPGVTQVFTHRIIKISDHGQAIMTEGTAVNKPDPWTITPADVEGVTVASAWGIGWLYRALAFMSVGVAILLFCRRFVPERDRRDTDRLISILLVAVPLAAMRPLLNAYTIGVTSTKKAGVDVVHVINTGLLPGTFHASGGSTISHVAPGREVALVGRVVSGAGVPFRETASLYWSGWLIAGLIIFVPAIGFGYDVARRRYRDEEVHEAEVVAPVEFAPATPTAPRDAQKSKPHAPDDSVPDVRHVFVLDLHERHEPASKSTGSNAVVTTPARPLRVKDGLRG